MAGMYDYGIDDVGSLKAEIRALTDDLKQCQADKDFVWSLWKKLQVANPDITQAISLVLQREKEKSEIKDRKVLEVLQIKDERIEELQHALTQKSREVAELAIRSNVNEDLNKFQNEVDRLREKNANLELQANVSLRSFENRERTLDDVRRGTIENSERDRMDLEQTVKELKQKLDSERSNRAESEANRMTLENQVMLLERDVTDKVRKFEGMISELDEAKKLLQQYESQMNQTHRDITYKNHELENVRRELSELWSSHNQLTEHSSQQADLIRQLQSLQQDTQKMLKSQEDAYSMEAVSIQDMYSELSDRYEKAKRTEADLRAQLHSVRKDLLDKDDVVAQLQSRVDSFSKLHSRGASALDGSFISDKLVHNDEPFMDFEYKIKRLDREVALLRDKLNEKERYIDRLEKKRDHSVIEFDVSHLNHHERTHSTPSRGLKDYRSIATSPMKDTTVNSRARSMSPVRNPKGSKYQIIQAERRVEDYKNMLKLKNRELEELKTAHAKRLERLKNVQADYKIVKDQLRALESSDRFSSKSKGQKKKRSDPKDLRHEDSKAVWNELAYFKNENRNLVVERMAMEEDIDSMKVKASQDAASIHELRIAVEQEKEERRHDRRKTDQRLQDRTDSQSELTLLRSEMQSKTIALNSLERELRDVRESRDQLQGEKRMLKSESLELKQQAAQHRMEVADLKREISRLERSVDDEKHVKEKLERDNIELGHKIEMGQKYVMSTKTGLKGKKRDPRSRSQVAKQYQKSLNKSIDKMKRVFRNFEDEGWEEISEDVEDEETESDTLGQAIVSLSRSTNEDSPPGYRGKRSGRPVHRINRVSLRNQRGGRPNGKNTGAYSSSSGTNTRTVVLRETATSPMPSPVRELKASSSPRNSEQKFNHNQLLRQLKHLKQRVVQLQQQVTTLREAKSVAKKSLEDNKDTSTQLQTDLSQANKRLQMAKQTIQKLTTDVEKVQHEKGQLEVLLASKDTVTDKHSEQDWKLLETRLKASSNEICRQSAQMRQLKQDNDMLQEQNRNLQDRINRLERDTSQKRTLLEEQRSKLKQVQSSAKTDANAVEELETKIKLLQETIDKNKTQVESLKKRLSAVTREKRDYEERFLKLTNELEKKTKQLIDTQNKKMELESSVGELENTAQQQLRGLATQSEMAIEAAQDKLTNAYRQIQNYQQFIKSLGHDLIKKTSRTRSEARESLNKRERDVNREANSSLQKAQSLAKNILNLSQSDIDDIMSADGDPERMAMDDMSDDKRRDKRWLKKCEKLVVSKDDFVVPLVELFVQKMEERVELLSQMYS
ncbi:centlein-like isoform X3 [Mytilus californianus]|uniref:centlein-like isoform X3 n=1 Tax=Mytilus californianus TaxID=6549 RepID=UPI002246BF0F|nr:centlein-like isoform X3 [Mytilus californianus]